MSFLARKGRIKLPPDVAAWVAANMEELKLTEAPLAIDVALAVSALDFPQGDPADHFIAATVLSVGSCFDRIDSEDRIGSWLSQGGDGHKGQ